MGTFHFTSWFWHEQLESWAAFLFLDAAQKKALSFWLGWRLNCGVPVVFGAKPPLL